MKYYRDLLRQGLRIEAFRRAIEAVVGPEDRVLEIGAGVGTYSFFAADAGAANVWAVEGAPVVHVAESIAKLNDYHDKVDFIRGWVPEVTLPDRATVLIFEDFASRLFGSTTFRLLSHARDHYLVPDAVWIPYRARLNVAPIRAGVEMDATLTPLGGENEVAYGIDWTPTREYVFNTPIYASIVPDSLASVPAILADTELGGLPSVEELGGTASWVLDEKTEIGGLAYWFDMELVPGEWLSNAPGEIPGSWGQVILPLDPPLMVEAGGELKVGVAPDRLADGAPGWLSWWASSGDVGVRGHEFASEPASFADLYGQSPDAKPSLSEKGRIEVQALQLVDGKRSVREIAAELKGALKGLSEAEVVRLVLDSLDGKTDRTELSDLGGATDNKCLRIVDEHS